MSYLTRFINRSATQREQLRADQTTNSAGRIRLGRSTAGRACAAS